VSRAEFGGNFTVDDKAHPLIEGRGVRIPSDPDAGYADDTGEPGDIVDQRRGRAAAHPIGIREEILKFEEAAFGDGCGEGDDPVWLHSRNPHSTPNESVAREDERFGMIDQYGSVTLIGERGTPEEILQADQVSLHSVSDTEVDLSIMRERHVPHVFEAPVVLNLAPTARWATPCVSSMARQTLEPMSPQIFTCATRVKSAPRSPRF
jgi:hypothetical protein